MTTTNGMGVIEAIESGQEVETARHPEVDQIDAVLDVGDF